MGFLDKAKNLGNKTVEESKKYAEVTKLNMTVNSHQDQLKGVEIKLGEFILHNGFEGLGEKEEFQTLLNQAGEIQKKISELQEQINKIKNVSICTNCGAEIPKEGKFCVNCGTPAPVAPEPETVAPETAAPVNRCPQCGVELEADALFCACCGAKVKKSELPKQ